MHSCILTTVRLIRLVLAVCVSVAFPVEVNALSAPAFELPGGALGLLRFCLAAAALHGLVRFVSAVGIPVAAPQRWDALRVVTSKLVRAAGTGGGSGAHLLVTGITAVVVPVADERGSHAHTVATLELFRRAGLCILREEER